MSLRIVFVVLSLMILETSLAETLEKKGFFEQRHRGWLWFDQREEEQKGQNGHKKQEGVIEDTEPTIEEMERARAANEKFAYELELLKHLMVQNPENLENIKRYKLKEKEMMEKAGILGKNWLLVNFLNPEILDELKSPQNIYGRDLKRMKEKEEREEKIRDLRGRIEIFVFRREGCVYCEVLEEHLARFARRYGFEVEAVSEDGSESKFFKTNRSSDSETAKRVREALDIDVMPAVIAVVKDTRDRYELARGAVSITDLEEKAVLLHEVIEGAVERGKR